MQHRTEFCGLGSQSFGLLICRMSQGEPAHPRPSSTSSSSMRTEPGSCWMCPGRTSDGAVTGTVGRDTFLRAQQQRTEQLRGRPFGAELVWPESQSVLRGQGQRALTPWRYRVPTTAAARGYLGCSTTAIGFTTRTSDSRADSCRTCVSRADTGRSRVAIVASVRGQPKIAVCMYLGAVETQYDAQSTSS